MQGRSGTLSIILVARNPKIDYHEQERELKESMGNIDITNDEVLKLAKLS